ncbi:MAG: hypothetical protein BGO67_08550 [Alphaproteobacteria bacterium 41-28]|nr:MAG: hypothetical protein BGO67_08550 [Alphaproteobacteria bacterium 41-28]
MTALLRHSGKPGEGAVSPFHSLPPKARRELLKVAVVREEFVELTGDPLVAIVLNQLLYWTERVNDYDLLLEEEKKSQPEYNASPRHGWIYKTADELNEETMLRVSRPTMRKYLRTLVEQGWIDERSNPQDKWDKTTQYRVNLKKLQEDLFALGYALPGYSLGPIQQERDDHSEASKPVIDGENEDSTFQNISSKKDNESSKKNIETSAINVPSKEKNLPLGLKTLSSEERNLTSYTYTETTSETTNREHAQRTGAREDFSIAEEMVALWEQHICQKLTPANWRGVLQLTEERKSQLESLFSFHFQNDSRLWEQFCLRVKASPFLMGEGARRWRVSLDWILLEGNILKVLEGNFDDPKILDQTKEEAISTNREEEKAALLASIEDPVWKEWCSQLNFDFQSPDSVSLKELREIAHAKFLEVEDGKLVWVGSSDKNTLSRIEDLRLKLFPIIEKTFPNTRALRTRLCEEKTFSQCERATFAPIYPTHHQVSRIGETHA